MCTKRFKRRKSAQRWRLWLLRLLDWCRRLMGAATAQVARWLARWCSPRAPRVIVFGYRRDGRRLRRAVARMSRAYAGALGAALPPYTTIVIASVVFDGQQRHGLLQAFDPANGPRRYILHLATSVGGRMLSDDDLFAALRHQVALAVADAVATPSVSLPVDLETPPMPPATPIVAWRPAPIAGRNGTHPGDTAGDGHRHRHFLLDDDPA